MSESMKLGGRYRLLNPLGDGAVRLAFDEAEHRDVAVRDIRALPADEAHRALGLRHPSIVSLLDVVVDDGGPWMVMEFVSGASLEHTVASRRPLPELQAARIGVCLLSALSEAHAAGIVHGNLNPGKVLLTSTGRAVLTGFGLPHPGLPPAGDLWSLAATLHFAIEGRPPGNAPAGDDEPLRELIRAMLNPAGPPPIDVITTTLTRLALNHPIIAAPAFPPAPESPALPDPDTGWSTSPNLTPPAPPLPQGVEEPQEFPQPQQPGFAGPQGPGLPQEQGFPAPQGPEVPGEHPQGFPNPQGPGFTVPPGGFVQPGFDAPLPNAGWGPPMPGPGGPWTQNPGPAFPPQGAPPLMEPSPGFPPQSDTPPLDQAALPEQGTMLPPQGDAAFPHSGEHPVTEPAPEPAAEPAAEPAPGPLPEPVPSADALTLPGVASPADGPTPTDSTAQPPSGEQPTHPGQVPGLTPDDDAIPEPPTEEAPDPAPQPEGPTQGYRTSGEHPAYNPHAFAPPAEPPYAEQPYAEPPYAEQPYAQQPYTEQPYGEPPYAEQPPGMPLQAPYDTPYQPPTYSWGPNSGAIPTAIPEDPGDQSYAVPAVLGVEFPPDPAAPPLPDAPPPPPKAKESGLRRMLRRRKDDPAPAQPPYPGGPQAEDKALDQVIGTTGPMPPARVAAIGLAVLDQLVVLHSRGEHHGDVRPGSILLSPTGQAILVPPLMRTGISAYTAPEGSNGPTADLWSLGATLFAAVEGLPPAPGAPLTRAGTLAPVLYALLSGDPALRPQPASLRQDLLAVAEAHDIS
ncbi:protein kinase [Nonomuraea sp. NBC_01738]|uniref:protein kinase domain-containing protein n=1 Tax=Nonomuraea sp. NBC_01738 TaxID=2976003 RepID=UPI002E15513C|nr:protein kinase [Nonomuraea sp. NBC_01738]